MAARRSRGRPTLAQVAARAGVAESTASRVINGYSQNFRVRPEVRERIFRAASELNYRANPVVRTYEEKQTNLIAVVGWASDGVNRTAVAEAVRVCDTAGKHVCTTFLHPDSLNLELPSWRVDGALVLQSRRPDDVLELEARGLPYVSINGLATEAGDSVTFNEEDGMRQLVDHLASLGHTRIAYAYVERERHIPRGLRHGAVRARREAYITHMERHGLEPLPGHDHSDIDHLDYIWTYVIGQRATALIAYDDITALFLIQAAHVLGLSVPKDLSVVTFNDEMPARMATPPLTTVAVPAVEAGRRAGELLLEQLRDPSPESRPKGRRVVLKQQLVIRRSTAQPQGDLGSRSGPGRS
ncbi:MAG: LacI family DNA-binding transcriptional regulator [Planctomycetota bacterium]